MLAFLFPLFLSSSFEFSQMNSAWKQISVCACVWPRIDTLSFDLSFDWCVWIWVCICLFMCGTKYLYRIKKREENSVYSIHFRSPRLIWIVGTFCVIDASSSVHATCITSMFTTSSRLILSASWWNGSKNSIEHWLLNFDYAKLRFAKKCPWFESYSPLKWDTSEFTKIKLAAKMLARCDFLCKSSSNNLSSIRNVISLNSFNQINGVWCACVCVLLSTLSVSIEMEQRWSAQNR